MLAVGLALGASVAWGLSDFLGGLRSRTGPLVPMLLISQLFGLVLSAVALPIWAGPPPGAGTLGWAALSGVFDLLGLWALYRGLALGAMSAVAPIASAGAALPVAFGLVAGERPPPVVLAAIVLAIVGIAASSHEESRSGELRPVLSKAVVFGLLAALGFGAGFIAIGQASEASVPWTVVVNRLGSVAVVATAWFAAGRTPLRETARDPRTAGIGVLDVAAIACFAVASANAMISVTATLSSLYPLVTATLAALVLGERVRGVQRAGVAAAVTAAAVIGSFGPAAVEARTTSPRAANAASPHVSALRLVPLGELERR